MTVIARCREFLLSGTPDSGGDPVSAHNILSELSNASAGGGKVIDVIGASDAVPSGVAGYAKGCILIKPGTDAYLNDGDASACDFKAISHAS